MQDIILLIVGLLVLVAGGEGLVRGSVSIARALKLSTLLISAVIIGFGTSMPEMVVSVQAALAGAPDIALGNIVGSNICNTSLILGLAAIMCPVACGGANIKRDIIIGLLAAVILCDISFLGYLGRISGVILLAMLIGYITYCVRSERKHGIEQHDEDIKTYKMAVALPLTIGGLALLVLGAKMLVIAAVSIAHKFGISEAVIGLTIVALGTSLPELATAIIASYRKQSDVVIGNIFGSNYFNILGILGVTALVNPIPFKGQIADIDVWIMVAVVMLPLLFAYKGGKFGRLFGAIMLTIYTAYIGYLAHV